jgi:hypothetical protein
MTEREIERLAELVSIKTNEKYLQIAKEIIHEGIILHSAQCEAKKFGKLKSFLSAVSGGVIVASISWLLRKP